MELFPHSAERRGNASHWVVRFFQTVAKALDFVPNLEPLPPNPKFLDAGFCCEAEIALNVHDFVIAVHGDDSASAPRRFTL
ncbi:hypothetical protein VIGAN_07125300 [Vigna angularis var. angularis]|uniref:Uncharacterized protein n=1 Tax=Vigna angularis var. angularis TaxID=157739 RepID=A0A0S3SI29_PHAAN|nr:hypothetical protein VIGAN_07125300 [Vigna angularis var. angularis]